MSHRRDVPLHTQTIYVCTTNIQEYNIADQNNLLQKELLNYNKA